MATLTSAREARNRSRGALRAAAAARSLPRMLLCSGFFVAGFAGLLWWSARPGVQLQGGLVSGRWVACGLALTAVAAVARFGRGGSRVMLSQGLASRALATLLGSPRVAALGSLAAALALSSFNPVEVGPTLVLIDADDPINLPTHLDAVRAEAAALTAEAEKTGLPADFGNPELNRLAADEARADAPKGDDSAWLNALRALAPMNERLAAVKAALEGRSGGATVVLSPRYPGSAVAPWPVLAGAVYNRWVCVDPKAGLAGGAIKMVAYSVGNTPAVENTFLGGFRVPAGTDPKTLRVKVTYSDGAPAVEVPCSGYHRDKAAFRVVVPRDRQIQGVEVVGHPHAPLVRAGDIRLGARRLVASVDPGLRGALESAYGVVSASEVANGPLAFGVTGTGANAVRWIPATGKPADVPTGPVLEVRFLRVDESAPKELTWVPRGLERTPLGGVWMDGGTRNWPLLKQDTAAAGLDAATRVLVAATGPRSEADAVVLLARRDALRPHWVTVYVPEPSEASRLESEQRKAVRALLVLASDLAARGDTGREPPTRDVYLTERDSDRALPLETGPKPPAVSLPWQLAGALRGGLDARHAETPSNSVKGRTWIAAAALLAGLVSVALAGSAAEAVAGLGRS